jgi:predicted metal-dependent HD superfamily phosphohydrolase
MFSPERLQAMQESWVRLMTCFGAGGDTDILLDADLAILGAEVQRYLRYAEDIRHEYEWVDDAKYRAGRVKVLQAFLDRNRIYRTQRMFVEGEQAARNNMYKEMLRLRA